jgi:glycerophosphoryl diester phosphodiesterase
VNRVFVPRPARHRAARRGRAALIGHRGGRGEGWPSENTLAAFARAHGEGAQGIELDARTCRGGEVVVVHDADLARVTGGAERRAVAEVTLEELGRVPLGASGGGLPRWTRCSTGLAGGWR